MRFNFIFWSVFTISIVEIVKCWKTNYLTKVLNGELNHSQSEHIYENPIESKDKTYDVMALTDNEIDEKDRDSWISRPDLYKAINSRKEIGWLETSTENLAWKIGLKILEYCTDLYVNQKTNCMQFYFKPT